MDEKPPPVGAPLPPFKECPQAAIVPSACNAANALWVDAIETKPATDGAPLPPYELCPHAAIVPFGLSAAKLYWFVAMETKVPVGAPLPPFELSPHATIEPSPARAAVAYRLTLCPLHEPGHSPVKEEEDPGGGDGGGGGEGDGGDSGGPPTTSWPGRTHWWRLHVPAIVAFCDKLVGATCQLWPLPQAATEPLTVIAVNSSALEYIDTNPPPTGAA